MLPVTIRIRIIAESDFEFIQTTVNGHWDKGSTYISRILCKKWNLYLHNGRLKDMACKEVLLNLHRKGLISIPNAKYTPNKNIKLIHVIDT